MVAGKGYRVVPPPGWERTDSAADLTFRQPALEAGLMAQGTCEGTAPDRSLPVLARHLRFGLRDVRGLETRPVELAGHPGLDSRFEATLDGIPVAVRAVTLRDGRCAYDLVVVAPAGRLAAVEPDFLRFTASFRPVAEPGL